MTIAQAIIILGCQLCATWVFTVWMRIREGDVARGSLRTMRQEREEEEREAREMARKLAIRDMRRRLGN